MIAMMGRVVRIVCLAGLLIPASELQAKGLPREDNQVIRRGPVPGRIIVSVSQGAMERDYFLTQNGEVLIRGNASATATMANYGALRVRKAFHIGANATFVLNISEYGREKEVIEFLKGLPDVRYVEQDYYIELLAEPNDTYYSTNTANYWVPDDIESGQTAYRDAFGCPSSPGWVNWPIPDTSEIDDQWYLRKIEANKAWDIEKGDSTVRIMVMDSGIDIAHPDLSANIWRNLEDPIGDKSGDGLPGDETLGDIDNDGGQHFNDPDIRNKDWNRDTLALWGDDLQCDAGPDGDYGFGPNGIDDPPPGPGGGDDDTLVAGPNNDPWDDNLRGPGCFQCSEPNFDDDMWEVQFAKNDDDENGYPDDYYGFNFYQPDSLPVDQGCPITEACHGTVMAGIIGAVTDNAKGIAGVAWNCKMVSAKIDLGVPEFSGDGNITRIAEALYYAVEKNIDIVNMSLGISANDPNCDWNSPTIAEAIDSAYAHGIILVAGAGNESWGTYWYPASFDHVISVSGTNRFDVKASYTEYNDRVDACAPVAEEYPNDAERGDECISTGFSIWPYPLYSLPDAELPHDYVVTKLRTSGATAQVSGLAGLLISHHPKDWYLALHPLEADSNYVDWITNQIKRGCEPISGSYSNLLGAGRINAYRSLTHWGYIGQDTTWAGSIYLSGDIKVGTGATLTIEPGTTVYIATDDISNIVADSARVAIGINGAIIAIGTEENPITFKSFSDDPQPGDWYGIFFGVDGASGSFSHCVIQDAKYGVVSQTTVELDHCEITNCELAGIYLCDDWDSTCVVDNESVIRHCTISENDGVDASGMLIWNCPLEVTVDSCTVNMNYRGIWASNSRPTISWSEIAMNQEDGIWVTSYQYEQPYPYPTIERCQIYYNGEIGIHCQYNKAEVSYTKVNDNGSYGLLAYGADAYPEIDHSKIIDNAISGVRAEVSGMPMLGSVVLGKGQNNALYGQYKDVYNANAAALYAENCWWGVAPPDRTKMYGTVDYTPYLTSDPVPNLSPLAPQERKMPPAVFALEQNYPNPFGLASPTTSIRYSLPPSPQKAELKVYDVSGRLVRTLLNDVRDGDRYVAVWDGKNEHGTQVAAGIYFYKLRLGTKSMTKKMVLFR